MNLLIFLGQFLVGFGVMGIVWFARKLFRPRTTQTTAKTIRIKWLILSSSLILCTSGWYIYSGFDKIPKGGLIFGGILGIRALINEHTGRWY